MVYLRSLIFNILFYGVTVLLALLVLPSLLLPAAVIRAAARLWGWITVQTLRIAGGTHRLSGDLPHTLLDCGLLSALGLKKNFFTAEQRKEIADLFYAKYAKRVYVSV